MHFHCRSFWCESYIQMTHSLGSSLCLLSYHTIMSVLLYFPKTLHWVTPVLNFPNRSILKISTAPCISRNDKKWNRLVISNLFRSNLIPLRPSGSLSQALRAKIPQKSYSLQKETLFTKSPVFSLRQSKIISSKEHFIVKKRNKNHFQDGFG